MATFVEEILSVPVFLNSAFSLSFFYKPDFFPYEPKSTFLTVLASDGPFYQTPACSTVQYQLRMLVCK
jgi:hypothetical protein